MSSTVDAVRNFVQRSVAKCLPPWNGNSLRAKDILLMKLVKPLVIQ